MNFLSIIGNAIAQTLLPIVEEKGKQLLDKAGDKGEELLAQVIDKIGDEIEKRIPAMTAALVTAVTEAVGQMAIDGVDKVTDVIPGQLDDEILDPIIERAVDIFRQFGLGR